MKKQTFSGIDVLGKLTWGTHFCQFYNTRQDLLEILIPYFKTGLENNEFCLWITSDPVNLEEAIHEMETAVSGFDRYLAEGRIEFLSYNEWYLKEGNFNAESVINRWYEKLERSIEKGFTGMRVNGNERWLRQEYWKDFMDYEYKLTHFLSEKRMIILCTYSLEKIHATDVLDVALVHDCAISKREGKWHILETPYYKRSKAQLQIHNEELEQRVIERTAQLAKINKQLRELSIHLQNVFENERTAIAREIHDELGQQLTALKMDIGWLNKRLPDDIVLKEKVSGILSQIGSILKTVKKIAFELRPDLLNELGLIEALKWQANDLERHTGIKCWFHCDLKDFNPGKNLSVNIFRIYQQALTNIARHAHATETYTSLEIVKGWITLVIKDNGQGFDTDKNKKKYSLGLTGMKERALMLQGELTIQSKKQEGTTVILRVPYMENNKDES